jgi:NDP-sugar pyrophosphorylase family protein
VTLVDTGENTATGGRLKRVREYVGDETFCLTYGDGVSDVDLPRLIDFHRQHGKLATVTAVQPPGRYGALDVQGEQVRGFQENRWATVAGSMAASSCSSRPCSITSRAMAPPGKTSPCVVWPRMAN